MSKTRCMLFYLNFKRLILCQLQTSFFLISIIDKPYYKKIHLLLLTTISYLQLLLLANYFWFIFCKCFISFLYKVFLFVFSKVLNIFNYIKQSLLWTTKNVKITFHILAWSYYVIVHLTIYCITIFYIESFQTTTVKIIY